MKNTVDILRDKMQLVARNDQQNLSVVGPVKLPIKQGDFEATFQWYSWLTVNATDSKEDVLQSLAKSNLAFGQRVVSFSLW